MRRGRGRSGASRVALPGGLDVAVSGLSRSGRVVVLHPLPGRASVCSLVLNRRGDMVALRAEIERCPCCAAVSVARDFVPVAVVREGRFHVPELERLRELMMANIIEEARTWKPWRLPIT
jgi:hypothetical protein